MQVKRLALEGLSRARLPAPSKFRQLAWQIVAFERCCRPGARLLARRPAAAARGPSNMPRSRSSTPLRSSRPLPSGRALPTGSSAPTPPKIRRTASPLRASKEALLGAPAAALKAISPARARAKAASLFSDKQQPGERREKKKKKLVRRRSKSPARAPAPPPVPPGVDPALAAAVVRLQRWYRRVRAQREARADLQLLREWDALMAQVHRARLQQMAAQRAKERKAAAALAIQCLSRRHMARKQLRAHAALRLQCAARQKLARKRVNDTYWAYAFGLLDDESCTRLQRWWRMVKAKRKARADLQLLREFDAHMAFVAASKKRRLNAVVKMQRAVRRFTTALWVRSWAEAVSGLAEGKPQTHLDDEENPFSDNFVGIEEHRRRIEMKYGDRNGKLRKHGNISKGAMTRALPSQLATLYNTLRLVDAINHLIERRLVPVEVGPDGTLWAEYDDLMAWGEKALQARFAGATQYLKAAKSFGLVYYGGEMTAFLPKAATYVAEDGVELPRAPPPPVPPPQQQRAKRSSKETMIDVSDPSVPPLRVPPFAPPPAAAASARNGSASYRAGQASYRGQASHRDNSSCRVASYSVGKSRHELLSLALQRPHRVIPAMFASAKPRGKRRKGGGIDDGNPERDQFYYSRQCAIDRLTRLVHTVHPFRSQVLEFLHGSFAEELRECTSLLDDEFWPSSEEEEDAGEDPLKRAAHKAAVERVINAHDYFDVLMLRRDGDLSANTIKKAFLKLSKEVHPDKNTAKRAPEAFDRLNSAKMTLMDVEERMAYASLHPPRAAVAREWAKSMGSARQKFREKSMGAGGKHGWAYEA